MTITEIAEPAPVAEKTSYDSKSLAPLPAPPLQSTTSSRTVERSTVKAAASPPPPKPTAVSASSEPASAALGGPRKSKTVPAVSPSKATQEHVARFALETLSRDPQGALHVSKLPALYEAWAAKSGVAPLPEPIIAVALADLFRNAGRQVKNGHLLGITARAA